jgi:hypothetical protein
MPRPHCTVSPIWPHGLSFRRQCARPNLAVADVGSVLHTSVRSGCAPRSAPSSPAAIEPAERALRSPSAFCHHARLCLQYPTSLRDQPVAAASASASCRCRRASPTPALRGGAASVSRVRAASLLTDTVWGCGRTTSARLTAGQVCGPRRQGASCCAEVAGEIGKCAALVVQRLAACGRVCLVTAPASVVWAARSWRHGCCRAVADPVPRQGGSAVQRRSGPATARVKRRSRPSAEQGWAGVPGHSVRNPCAVRLETWDGWCAPDGGRTGYGGL